MLGKRPRPLLRATSKSQLMPNDPFDCPPACCQQAMLYPSPAAFVAPRQVIGFNPVSQKLDCEESPRSVQDTKALDGIAKVASQEKQAKSPRSPRSGLESLLSSPRPWDKKGSEGVGLGIVVVIQAKEDDDAKGRAAGVAQGPTALVSEVAPFKCCSPRSPTRSQPIPIAKTHLQASSRGKTQPSKAVPEDEHQACAWSRRGTRTQNRDLRVVVDDEEMESRESIFSTASPASSWNEYIGDLPLIDFLNSCFFCKRLLAPGKDIFMYRGDRAFCSAECRYQQIVIDERKERCVPISYRAGASVASGGASNLRTGVMAATTIAAA